MSSDRPRVSLGLPVYNGEDFLAIALDSSLAQTYTDFELVISDNCSTDATQEICRAYAERDPRIRYYRNEQNIGAARNYNRVFELSSGCYFKWVTHDDVLAPTNVQLCVNVLDASPSIILCYPRTIIIGKNGERLDMDPADTVDVRGDSPHERFSGFLRSLQPDFRCNALLGVIRSDILRLTPLIGGYAASDKILLAELALRGAFYQIPEPLFFRREHAASSVRANPSTRERNEWFNPMTPGPHRVQHWYWVSKYLEAIGRVPMSVGDRLWCYLELGRLVYWWRWLLARDLARSVLFWK